MSTSVGVRNPPIKHTWWKESSVYQIYPASFKDSNGDGLGDIPGIISKLDYIASLGVDIVWLSPILASPQVDMGYDISDYKAIHPPYGTMADHDALISGLHAHGLKYVMDLVVNHTSDQHEWFLSSRSSKTSPKRDWYYWRPARYSASGERLPPNNWESSFSGSAWTWDEETQEYYLHLFASAQPDLNWENPAVVAAVHDVIRFWLERGVDGFRMDVINFISKTPGLPDATPTKPGFVQPGGEHYACGPRLHEFFQGMGKILREFDAFSVGEMPGVHDTREILKAVGQDRGELAMAFQFEIVDMDHAPESKWAPRAFSPSTLRTLTAKWQTFMLANSGWNALYIENHDQGRSVTRYASDTPALRTISAKMLAAHLALQSGTVFVYQGQELAMAGMPQDWGMDKYKDIEVLNHWAEIQRDHPSDATLHETCRRQYRLIGRDNARTPMQWDASSASAGFVSGGDGQAEPWMSVHPDYATWNAAASVADPGSSFHYWRRVLALRKERKDVFVYGGFEMLDLAGRDESVIAYVRTEDAEVGGRRALVACSFAGQDVWWELPEAWAAVLVEGGGKMRRGAVLEEMRNYDAENEVKVGEDGKAAIKLRPYEVIVAIAEK